MKIIFKVLVIITLQMLASSNPLSQKESDPLHYVYANGKENSLKFQNESEFKIFFNEGLKAKTKNHNKGIYSEITLIEIKKGSFHLTNDYVNQLCKLIPLVKVHTLKLSGLEIGLNGAKKLANCLRPITTLKEVDLSGNKLTPEGKKELEEVFKANNVNAHMNDKRRFK